jgi:hypothetical protein
MSCKGVPECGYDTLQFVIVVLESTESACSLVALVPEKKYSLSIKKKEIRTAPFALTLGYV